MSGAAHVLALGSSGHWRECATIDVAAEDEEWYLFADKDAVLNPQLPDLLRIHGADYPDIDIFYGDEVIVFGPGRPADYICKPAFDASQLLARDYIGLPFAIRRRAMAALGGPDEKAGSARFYDMLLRALADGIGIDRIAEVLAVNPDPRFQPSMADRLIALRNCLPRRQPGCEPAPGLAPGLIEIRRVFETFPDVTLVIPTVQAKNPADRDDELARPMIVDLLDGICRSDWPMDRLTVLVGDDVEDDSIYQGRTWPFRFVRIITERRLGERFNYAVKINSLWRQVKTEHLIIMNDDLLVRSPGWIKALMTFAVEQSVGGVGARLLYPDATLQHAGMPAGVMGSCTHAFIGLPASAPTYQDWAITQREWSIVTGAVFATRRSVLEQVNGFDEGFSLDFNDVDLCLRLRLLGYRIVYTPHAELIHFESASRRGMSVPAEQTRLFLEKWQDYLRDDPAYHPNLTRTSPHIQPIFPTDAWWSRLVGQSTAEGL